MSKTQRSIDALRGVLPRIGEDLKAVVNEAIESLEAFAMPMNRLVDLLHNGAAVFGRAPMDVDSKEGKPEQGNDGAWGVQQERDMSWNLVHRLSAGMRAHEHAALEAFAQATGTAPDAKQAASARTEGALVSLGAELAGSNLGDGGASAVSFIKTFMDRMSSAIQKADGNDTAEGEAVRKAWDQFKVDLSGVLKRPPAAAGGPGGPGAVVGKEAIDRFVTPKVAGMARALVTMKEVADRATRSAAAAATALVSTIKGKQALERVDKDEALVSTVVQYLAIAKEGGQDGVSTFVAALRNLVETKKPDEKDLTGRIEEAKKGRWVNTEQALALMKIELSYMHEARNLENNKDLYALEVSEPDALLKHMANYGLGVDKGLTEQMARGEIEGLFRITEDRLPLQPEQQESLCKYREGAWKTLVDTEPVQADSSLDLWAHASAVASSASPSVIPQLEAEEIKAFIKRAGDGPNPLREELGRLQARLAVGSTADMDATKFVVRARLERLQNAFDTNLPSLYAMVNHNYADDAKQEVKGDAMNQLLEDGAVKNGGEPFVQMALARLGFDMSLVDRTPPFRALLDAFLVLLEQPHDAAQRQKAITDAEKWMEDVATERAKDAVKLVQQRVLVTMGEDLAKKLGEAGVAARELAMAYNTQVARAAAAEARITLLQPMQHVGPPGAGRQWSDHAVPDIIARLKEALLSLGRVISVPPLPDQKIPIVMEPTRPSDTTRQTLEMYLTTYMQWAEDTGRRMNEAVTKALDVVRTKPFFDEAKNVWKGVQKSLQDVSTMQQKVDALSSALRASNDLNFSLGGVLEVVMRLPAASLTPVLDAGPPPNSLPADDRFLRRLVGSYETLARFMVVLLVRGLEKSRLKETLVDHFRNRPRTTTGQDVTAWLGDDEEKLAGVRVRIRPMSDAECGGVLIELMQQWELFSIDVVRAHTSALSLHLTGLEEGGVHETRLGASLAYVKPPAEQESLPFEVGQIAVQLTGPDPDGQATDSDRAADDLAKRLIKHVQSLNRRWRSILAREPAGVPNADQQPLEVPGQAIEELLPQPAGQDAVNEAKEEAPAVAEVLPQPAEQPHEAKDEEPAVAAQPSETALEAVDCTVAELQGAESAVDRMLVRDAVYALLMEEELDAENSLSAQEVARLAMVSEQAQYPEIDMDRNRVFLLVRAVPPTASVMPSAVRDELRNRVRRALAEVGKAARQARLIAGMNGVTGERPNVRAMIETAFRDVSLLSAAQEKIAREASTALIHETARLCLSRIEALKRTLQLRLGLGAQRVRNEGTQAITRLVYQTLPELDRVALEIVNQATGTNDRDVAALVQRTYKNMQAADNRFYLVQTRTLAFASDELKTTYGYADTAMEQLVLKLRQMGGQGPVPRPPMQLGASTERGIEQLQRFVGLVAAHLGTRDAAFVLRARGFRVVNGHVAMANTLALRVASAVPVPTELKDMEERGVRGEARPSDVDAMAAYHEYVAYLEVKQVTESADLDATNDHRRRGAALWRAADAVCQPAITGHLEAVVQYVRSAHQALYDRTTGKPLGGSPLVAVGMQRVSGVAMPQDGRTISQDTYVILSRALGSEWARVYLAQAVAYSALLAGGIVLAVPPEEAAAAELTGATFLDARAPAAMAQQRAAPRESRLSPDQTQRFSEARSNALGSLVRWYLDASTWGTVTSRPRGLGTRAIA